DRAEPERADGDAELSRGQHARDVLHRGDGGSGPTRAGLGQRLDLAPPSGHDGELRADEERVAEQREGRDQQADPGAHTGPRPAPTWSPAAAPGAGWKRRRSTRRPSMRSTRSRPPSTSTSSPTDGTRPSRAMTKPPTVS